MDADEIRQRLIEHISEEEILLATIATEIGIAYNTMRWFIREEKDTSLRTLLRIKKYLDDFEITKHR